MKQSFGFYRHKRQNPILACFKRSLFASHSYLTKLLDQSFPLPQVLSPKPGPCLRILLQGRHLPELMRKHLTNIVNVRPELQRPLWCGSVSMQQCPQDKWTSSGDPLLYWQKHNFDRWGSTLQPNTLICPSSLLPAMLAHNFSQNPDTSFIETLKPTLLHRRPRSRSIEQ